MAKGAPTPSSFKKNDPRINRNGAPRLDPTITEIRELEKKDLTLQFSKQLRMSKDELRSEIERPTIAVKELGIAKGVLRWLETGSFVYIQPYIEYIFGKPVQHTEVVQMQFVFDFVGRVTRIINGNVPDNCPNCQHELGVRDRMILELEQTCKAAAQPGIAA